METSPISQLQAWIDSSRRIVFFGGAGVSTESGIPDFRSQDGLYHQQFAVPPETILSHTYFERHTEEFYRRRCDNVFNENPDEFTLDDYIRSIQRQAREELITRFGPGDSGLDSYFQTVFRKVNRIGAERFSREAELLADLAANDITAEARSLYNPWSYYCQAAFRDLAWA